MKGTEYRTSVDECSLVPCSTFGKEIIITCKPKVPIYFSKYRPHKVKFPKTLLKKLEIYQLFVSFLSRGLRIYLRTYTKLRSKPH